MKYLLDINVLIAWSDEIHLFHWRVRDWMASLNPKHDEIASCSIVDLGFVRIVSQLPNLDTTVEEAREELISLKLKSPVPFVFLNDHSGIEKLPAWVRHPKQITDGHLLQLAASHRAQLATLDSKVHGAYIIP